MTAGIFHKIYVKGTGLEWSKKVSDEEEYKGLLRFCNDRSKGEGANCIVSLFVPIRTNNLQNFSHDFFLPHVVNTAMKVDNIVLRIFLTLLFLPFDLLSLPLRCAFALPRYFANKSSPEHPLSAYLIREGAPADMLREGRVEVALSTITSNVAEGSSTEVFEVEGDVDLIEMPMQGHPASRANHALTTDT